MAPVFLRRAVRINSLFTKDQSTWIIFQYGAHRNCLAVRRKFRLHFMISPSKIPHISAFRRLVARFSGTGDVSPKSKTGGRPDITDEMVEDVKDFLLPYTTSKKSVSLNTLAISLGISYTTAWRIVRKRLGWYPYKPRNVVPLTERHKVDRVVLCDWLLEQAEGFEQKVMWSDEKWFVLKQKPNKQNEPYWAPCDPGVEVECREQARKKVMCWAGVIQGRIIIHWFDNNNSVNGDTYLDMLKTGPRLEV